MIADHSPGRREQLREILGEERELVGCYNAHRVGELDAVIDRRGAFGRAGRSLRSDGAVRDTRLRNGLTDAPHNIAKTRLPGEVADKVQSVIAKWLGDGCMLVLR
jgi:hypothetical protein